MAAEKSGEAAASSITVKPQGGVRYTVPSILRPQRMEEEQTLRFRVGDVYKNHYVSMYLNGERLAHRKRPVMAPGEMEELKLKREQLLGCPAGSELIVTIEEA